MVSPAPSSSARLLLRSVKICCARETAAYATDTGLRPISVWVRTSLGGTQNDLREQIELGSERAGLTRDFIGAFDLTHDLRLAEHL